MELPKNHIKRALAEGKVLYGLWNSLAGSYAVEAAAGAGFDWLLIDTEHSPSDLEDVLTKLQIVAGYPTQPVVRVSWNDMVTIKRYLDIGAQTLLIPQVNTPEEAAAAVAYTRYPPLGLRGVGGTTRATRFGRVKGYARHAHEEFCIFVQIESQQALDNIEAIAAVDGVDGMFIGPADLHASLGYPGETRHPEVTPIINQAIARIRAAGKAPGIVLTGDEQDVQTWVANGAQFIALGSDLGLLARNAERLIGRFKPG